MGRKYVCDYCGKRIQKDFSIIRKHNEGLPHLRMKAEHYEQYKDLQQILAESKHKPPCRSLTDHTICMFGILCRYRHHSVDQILEMQKCVEYAKQVQQKRFNRLHKNMRNIESRMRQFLCKRWSQRNFNLKVLPPSLQIKDDSKQSQFFLPSVWC